MRWGRKSTLPMICCSLMSFVASNAGAQDLDRLGTANSSQSQQAAPGEAINPSGLDPSQFVDCPPLQTTDEAMPEIQPYPLAAGTEIPGSTWAPTIKPHDPRTLARQAATVTLAGVVDDPSNPNPVRRAVVRLVTPQTPDPSAAPAQEPAATTEPAPTEPTASTADPSAAAPLQAPANSATPRVAERNEFAPDSTNSTPASPTNAADEDTGSTESPAASLSPEYQVQVLPIDPRLRTQTPSFRLSLNCLRVDPNQPAVLVLQVGEDSGVHAIKPSEGWTRRGKTNEWVLSLDSVTEGEELDWIVELPSGIEECSVEARVDLVTEETDEATDETETTESSEETEPSLAGPVSEDEASTEASDETTSEEESLEESDAYPALRPAPSPISNSSERAPRSLSDEPQVLAPRTRGVELTCEGPATTLLGASVIYQLQVTNRSTETLADLELTTDLPEGIFLEGRRRVLLGEEVPPGETVSLEVALRAHSPGSHSLKFVLVNDGLTVASTEQELTVLDGSMQVQLQGPTSLEAGKEGTFSVEIKYHGEEPVSDVVVTLQLHESLRVTTLEHAAGFDAERHLLAWRIVELKPGDNVQLRYKVIADQTGEFEQEVGVSAPTLDEPILKQISGTIVARTQPRAQEQEARGVRRSLSAPAVPSPGASRSVSGRTAARPVPPPPTRTASSAGAPTAPAPRQADPNGRVPLRDPPRVPR